MITLSQRDQKHHADSTEPQTWLWSVSSVLERILTTDERCESSDVASDFRVPKGKWAETGVEGELPAAPLRRVRDAGGPSFCVFRLAPVSPSDAQNQLNDSHDQRKQNTRRKETGKQTSNVPSAGKFQKTTFRIGSSDCDGVMLLSSLLLLLMMMTTAIHPIFSPRKGICFHISDSSVHLATTMRTAGKLHGKPCVANNSKKRWNGGNINAEVWRTKPCMNLSTNIKWYQMFLESFRQRNFLHRVPCTHRKNAHSCFYTRDLVTHRKLLHRLLHTHTDIYTHRHTHIFLDKDAGAFTNKNFAHRRFTHRKLLHTGAF